MTKLLVLVILPLAAAIQTSLFLAAPLLNSRGREWLRSHRARYVALGTVFLTVDVTLVLLDAMASQQGKGNIAFLFFIGTLSVTALLAVMYFANEWRRQRRDPGSLANWAATPIVFKVWIVSGALASVATWLWAAASLELPDAATGDFSPGTCVVYSPQEVGPLLAVVSCAEPHTHVVLGTAVSGSCPDGSEQVGTPAASARVLCVIALPLTRPIPRGS